MIYPWDNRTTKERLKGWWILINWKIKNWCRSEYWKYSFRKFIGVNQEITKAKQCMLFLHDRLKELRTDIENPNFITKDTLNRLIKHVNRRNEDCLSMDATLLDRITDIDHSVQEQLRKLNGCWSHMYKVEDQIEKLQGSVEYLCNNINMINKVLASDNISKKRA